MQGPYTPNLGHFGGRPSYVMHLPISEFSENCATLYGPPAQFVSSHAFYKPPMQRPILKVQSTTACPAAPAIHAPAASTQPPPAGSHSGDHAPSAFTSVVQPGRTPAPRCHATCCETPPEGTYNPTEAPSQIQDIPMLLSPVTGRGTTAKQRYIHTRPSFSHMARPSSARGPSCPSTSPPCDAATMPNCYPAAAAAYAPVASQQPPPAGPHSGAHARSTSTSAVHPEHAPAVRHLSM
jgi:hypothetical protein